MSDTQLLASRPGITTSTRSIFPRLESLDGETLRVDAPHFLKEDFHYDFIDGANFLIQRGRGGNPVYAQPDAQPLMNQPNGILRLFSGANGGQFVADGIMLWGLRAMRPSLSGCALEARLRINTTLTLGSFGLGFMDLGIFREPVAVSALVPPSTAVQLTFDANLANGVGLVYDVGSSTQHWYAAAMKSSVQSLASDTAVTPTVDTFAVFRIEILPGGETLIYRNGTQIASGAAAVSATSLLVPYVYANSSSASQVTLDLDYLAQWSGR